jgi:hypothetical protein
MTRASFAIVVLVVVRARPLSFVLIVIVEHAAVSPP